MALIACMFFLPEAYSIGISFSAQDGSGSVSLISIFHLDDSVSANEGSSMSFGQVGIFDTRVLSGTGDIKADQYYLGSGGYMGSASFSTTGSGSLTGTANLTPSSLSASQGISASGSSSAQMILTNGGTAGVSLQVPQGSMISTQSLSIGSAHASGNSHITGSFTSNTYSTGSSPIDRNNVPDVYESVDLYQNAQAPGTPGTYDHATFNVNPQTKIQPSVDVARPYDTVSAGQGIFGESVDVWQSLTVQGAGAGSTIVDSGNQGSVFTVNSGVNTLISGMTIQGGTGTQDSTTGEMFGGGIYNLGTLTVDSCTISGNTATNGGGVYNRGTATINGGTISGNKALCGGGICDYGTVTINGGTISGNTATWGGGVESEGITTINGGTISGNTATNGGGVENEGITTINGGTISGNTADYGGGVYNYNTGTTAISGGTISSNSAQINGGGIVNEGTIYLYKYLGLDNIAIKKNSAALSGIGSGGGIYNTGTIPTGYGNCNFGIGADANTPNDHN